MRLQIIYNMYKEDLALNNLQSLIRHETQPNPTQPNYTLRRPQNFFNDVVALRFNWSRSHQQMI